MPRTIRITVYDIDELEDDARETARQWYRQDALPYCWHEFVIDDFTEICNILGIQLQSSKSCPQHIFFSGFTHQGDGASFEGSLRYVPGCRNAIRRHAPEDATLHDIADRIFGIQRRNFYQLTADIRQSGYYCHEYTMQIHVERDSPCGHEPTPGADSIMQHALRDLARWLYRELERAHDYLNSDEIVDEDIAANEWKFTSDGRFCRHAVLP